MRKRNYRVAKKAVCLLMTGAMLFTGVPTGILTNNGVEQVYAEEYTVGESTYRYNVSDERVIITRYTGSDTEITIPDEIEGKKVEFIQSGAFFYGGGDLVKINIPEGVTYIATDAFSGCGSLKEINVSENNSEYKSEKGVLFTKSGKILCKYPQGKEETQYCIPEGVTDIQDRAFEDCTCLRDIVIPDGVESIGFYTFSNCTSLGEITIPEGVTSIEDGAFSGCSSMEEIVLPEGLTSTGDYAFSRCSSLNTIIIPEGVKNIGDNTFDNCISLKEINVSENNSEYKSIDGVLFNKTGGGLIRYPQGKEGTQYCIPIGVVAIAGSAFEGCSSLSVITIPNEVMYIGSNAFAGCSSLNTINIPDGVFIETNMFSGCSNLKEINVSDNNLYYKTIDGVLFNKSGDTLYIFPNGKEETMYCIPEDVTEIAYKAFSGCSNLCKITIPEGVTWIGDYTFENCRSLTDINIPQGVERIGQYTFDGCSSLSAITIPDGVNHIDSSAFLGCGSLIEINISENNSKYKSIDGVLFSKSGDALVKYPEAKEGTQYSVPEGVTYIGWGAFSDCKSLCEITMPEEITSIEEQAFLGCSNLKEIKLSKSIEDIGDFAIGYNYDADKFEKCKDFVIYGYTGTAAEKYAIDNGFMFEIIKETLLDEEKNIVVEYPEDAVTGNVDLQVNELTENDESYKNLNLEEKLADTNVSPEDMKFKVYDIKLLDEETNEVQPTGEVTVKLPCPEGYETGKCKVYHIDSEGNVTDMNAVYDGEYFVFTTNHFSVYLVTENILNTTPEYISGDVNGDGNIDTQDAVLLKKYLAGYTDLGIIEDACDVNKDGSIDSADAVILLKHLAGYEGMIQ